MYIYVISNVFARKLKAKNKSKNLKRVKTQGSRQFSGRYIGFNKQFSAQFYMEKTVFH